MAVTRAILYVEPVARLKLVVSPLLRLLAASKEVERVVLTHIELLARVSPVCTPSFLLDGKG